MKRDEKMILRASRNNSRLTSVDIQQDLLKFSNVDVSPRTVQRRLAAGGLF